MCKQMGLFFFVLCVNIPGITKVIGYGAETEAPSSDDLPGSAVLKPGDVTPG